MIDNIYMGPESRNSEWQEKYRLRFVLDGMRTLSREVVLKCLFMFKSNRVCKSDENIVFFWCRQDQKGTGGTEMFFLTGRRNKRYLL